MTGQAENDARIELAFELARYIHRYPVMALGMEERIGGLTELEGAELGQLLTEVEYWFDQFRRKGETP